MNKWQIICPLACFGIIAAFGVVLFHQQGRKNAHALTQAVTHQLDRHSQGIASLLSTMRTNEIPQIEDEVFSELMRMPSTSLIRRSDVRVTRSGDGHLECVVNTTRYGLPPRTIHEPF